MNVDASSCACSATAPILFLLPYDAQFSAGQAASDLAVTQFQLRPRVRKRRLQLRLIVRVDRDAWPPAGAQRTAKPALLIVGRSDSPVCSHQSPLLPAAPAPSVVPDWARWVASSGGHTATGSIDSSTSACDHPPAAARRAGQPADAYGGQPALTHTNAPVGAGGLPQLYAYRRSFGLTRIIRWSLSPGWIRLIGDIH